MVCGERQPAEVVRRLLRDAGRTFGAPVRLDDDGSLGASMSSPPDGSAVAAYVEFANQRADFRVRRITRSGEKSAPVVVSNVAGNRSSGYPRMALSGNELIFAGSIAPPAHRSEPR